VLLTRFVERLGGDLDLGVECIDLYLDLPGLLPLVRCRGRGSRDCDAQYEYEEKNERDRCASANTQSATSW
jgi:hypothetical protein